MISFKPSKILYTALFLIMWCFVPTQNIYAANELCEASIPSSQSVIFRDTHVGFNIGFNLYNRQISGDTLRNAGGANWWLVKDLTPTSTINTFQATLVIDYHATSVPTFSRVFNNYGPGTYTYLTNSGMNITSGCPGDTITNQTAGYAQFTINSLGIYDYVVNPIGYQETVVPTVAVKKYIEILQPTYGTTTPTTTVNIKINYQTPFTLDFRPTTTRHYEIVDAVTGELQYSYSFTLPPLYGEDMQLNQTITLPTGSKYIRAMYLDQNGAYYSDIDEKFFNVATNTYFALTGLLSPQENPNDLSQINCELFDVGCQFQKAITFLFVPSVSALYKFNNLWQIIADKKPFGYITVTITQLESLNSSGSAAFSLGTVPFMDSIFSPFRTLIAGILWALFAIHFFQNRLRHLDI